MRTIGPFVAPDDGRRCRRYSLFWAVEGRGRKGVTCDLRQPEGQALFRRLARHGRRGLRELPARHDGGAGTSGPDDCDERLVWVRISVFGQDGPYSKRPGLDRLGIGYGGLLHLTGLPRPPAGPSGRHRLRLPHRRVRGRSRDRRAVRARRARHRSRDASSTPRSTAPSSASSSGRSPATTASASCASVRATGWPTARRSTTTPPPTASTCASSPGPTPTSAGSATRWAGPTWSTDPAVGDARATRRARRRDQRHRRRLDVGAHRGRGRGRVHRPRRPGRHRLLRGRHRADPHMAARGDLVTVDDPVARARPPAGAVPPPRRRAARRRRRVPPPSASTTTRCGAASSGSRRRSWPPTGPTA